MNVLSDTRHPDARGFIHKLLEKMVDAALRPSRAVQARRASRATHSARCTWAWLSQRDNLHRRLWDALVARTPHAVKPSLFVGTCLALLVACVPLFAAEPAADAEAQRLAIAVEALDRLKGMDLESNAAVKTAVYKVLAQLRGRPQFVEIVRDFNIKDQDPELLRIALKYPQAATGVDALRWILENGSFDLVKGVLQGTNKVQAITLAQLAGNTEAHQIAGLLKPLLGDPAFDFALRQQAVRSLARVETGVASILAAAIEGKLLDDLKPLASAELSKVRWSKLRDEAASVLPVAAGGPASGKMPPVAELVKRAGNPERGAAVFRREESACIKCHQVEDQGIDFGPRLSEIGTKLGKDALYEAILNPSAGISFGYEAWALELKNGDEPFGLIVSETPDEVAVKAQSGIVTRFRKADVIRREQQKTSIMPAGLEQTMTVEDLVDLVEYLTTLKKASQ